MSLCLYRRQTEWTASVVLVLTNYESLQFCNNYWNLNSVTVRDDYPRAGIKDYIECFGEATIFSKLNTNNCKLQMKIPEEDWDKTAFNSHCSLFRLVRKLFRRGNAPETSIHGMEVILPAVNWQLTFVYVHTIGIFWWSPEQPIAALELYKIRWNKQESLCNWKVFAFPNKVHYLRNKIRLGRLEICSNMSNAINGLQNRTKVAEVKVFLGPCNVYKWFVLDFEQNAVPPCCKIREGKPQRWTEMKAFETSAASNLKQKLVPWGLGFNKNKRQKNNGHKPARRSNQMHSEARRTKVAKGFVWIFILLTNANQNRNKMQPIKNALLSSRPSHYACHTWKTLIVWYKRITTDYNGIETGRCHRWACNMTNATIQEEIWRGARSRDRILSRRRTMPINNY